MVKDLYLWLLEITTHAWPLFYHEQSGVTTHDLYFVMSGLGITVDDLYFIMNICLVTTSTASSVYVFGGHPWPLVCHKTVRMTPLGPWKGRGSVFVISRLLMLLQSCCRKGCFLNKKFIHCRAVGEAPEHHRMSKCIAVLFVDLDQLPVFYSMEVKIATVCSWLAACVLQYGGQNCHCLLLASCLCFTVWRSKLPLSALG